MATISRNVSLYGTDEPVAEPRIVRVGRLSFELDAGNLRHIRIGDLEAIRAISWIVRDPDWGTYNPRITELAIDEAEDRIEIAYRATVGDDRQSFGYRARIVAGERQLRFDCTGEPLSPFRTNRTGFVVLHPLRGVSGRPVDIEHADGEEARGEFPHLIAPYQPLMNLRSLRHEAAPGLYVTCRMIGDVFETEDQRNWSDASYKTYVRPLALPWPYRLEPGQPVVQAIELRIDGPLPPPAKATAASTVAISAVAGRVPPIGVGLTHDDARQAAALGQPLRALAPGYVICSFDPRRDGAAAALAAAVELAREAGVTPWLEAVIASVTDYERELDDLAERVRALGDPFPTVLVTPAADLIGTLPGSEWPPAPPPEAFYRAARAAFPALRLGGGILSFFTELNRKRPPTADLDLVTFTTAAAFHAGDDRTIIENLETLPYMADTARAIAGSRPFVVGPSAIGLRMNPYGEAPVANPTNIRLAMSLNDPRQRGLLGAAWALGHFAGFAEGGAEAIAIGSIGGAHGVVPVPSAWPQPFYDERGAETGVFPIFHVIRALARLAGLPRRALAIDPPGRIAALAVERDGGLELLAANLTPERQTVTLPIAAERAAWLDSEHFVAAARQSTFLDELQPLRAASVTLDAFAIARVVGAGG